MTATTLDRPSRPTRSAPTTRRRWVWGWVALSSVAIAAYFVQQYARGTLDELAGRHVGLASAYADRPFVLQLVFYAHVVSAGLALLLGPFQFAGWLRKRHPRIHRTNGKAYLISVGIGSITGFAMAFFSSVGLLGFFAFLPLSLLWAWTGWRAYQAARARQFRSHQAWVIRNFSLTYAAVTLRLWFGLLIAIQLPFAAPGSFEQILANAYAPVPYLAWIPNLVVAELILRARGLPALRIAR